MAIEGWGDLADDQRDREPSALEIALEESGDYGDQILLAQLTAFHEQNEGELPSQELVLNLWEREYGGRNISERFAAVKGLRRVGAI